MRGKPALRWLFAVPLGIAAALFLIYDPKLYFRVVFHLTAIPAVLYPMIYRNSPWRRGATGKALFNKALSLALLFVIVIIGFWLPFGSLPYVRGVAMTYLGIAITYQLIVMYRLKRSSQAAERAKHTPPTLLEGSTP